MNTINNISAQNMTRQPADRNQLTQDSFMTMLLTQLQAQDPLKPFDASTMMQQIAQLTGLSASEKLVDSVSALKASTGVSQVISAAQLVGKQVEIPTDKLSLTDRRMVDASVVVPTGVDKVDISIFDQNGNKVRTLPLSAVNNGVVDFTWDGLDDQGKPLAEGFYTMSAAGILNGGEELPLITAAAYKVNSVALDSSKGRVILNVEGLGSISMDDVVKIL